MAEQTDTGSLEIPQDPPEFVLLDRMDFVGGVIGMILYGISITLFIRSLRGLLDPPPQSGRPRNIPLSCYVVILFGISTVYVAMNMHITELAHIDNRLFPGGPVAYNFSIYGTWRVVIPNACFILCNWLADALMLYRAKIIFEARIAFLAAPAILFMASLAFGILTLYQASQPEASLWTSTTVDVGLSYFSIAVTLNVLLTLIIAGHLLRFRRSLQGMSSSNGSHVRYTSIVTMLIESCTIYAVSSLIFIGAYAAEHPSSALFLPILHQAQVIAPLLIISRVASNKGFTTNVSATAPQYSQSSQYNASGTLAGTVVGVSTVKSGGLSSEKLPKHSSDV